MVLTIIKNVLITAIILESVGFMNSGITRALNRGQSDITDTLIPPMKQIGNYSIVPLIKSTGSVLKSLGKGLLAMLIDIFQIPIDIIWSMIPALSHIPLPSFAHVIGVN